MLNVFSIVILSVAIKAVMLSAIMLSVIMLSVVAPNNYFRSIVRSDKFKESAT
jgi:hypothetical protein